MNSENQIVATIADAVPGHSAPARAHGLPGRAHGFKVAGIVLVAALGFAACSSDPSAQRVAKDLVNTLATSDDQRDCMLDKIDGYDKKELETIAKAAADVSQNVGELSGLEQFEADLASCG